MVSISDQTNTQTNLLWNRREEEVNLSTWKQVELMRRNWPLFKILHRTRWEVLWEGCLRPLCQPYTVQVWLPRTQGHSGAGNSPIPRVTVVNPLLHQRSDDPSEPIPHHYPNLDHPELPFLCLYDPAANEWHSSLSVARTIVPWTIDWLACYEGWLATGEWTGGGRHG